MLRKAAFAADLVRARQGTLPWPLKVTVALTSRCPVACQQCGIWSGPNHDWKLEEIETFVGANPKLTWVNLTGGELFSHPDGEAIFDPWLRLKRLAFFHFPTSGWQPDPAFRTITRLHTACAHLGIQFAVSISIDGPQEVHDQRRGREGSFERAVSLLRRLREKKVAAFPGMTVDAHNAPLIPDTLKALEELANVPAKDVHFNLVHEAPHYYQNPGYLRDHADDDINPADLLPPQPGISARAILERRYRHFAKGYVPGQPSPVPCGVGKASLFLAADTTVYPCTIWQHPIGHLRQTLFCLDPIWHGMLREQARALIAAEKCPGCWTPCEANVTLLVGGEGPRPMPATLPGEDWEIDAARVPTPL